MPLQLRTTYHIANPYPFYHELRSTDPVHWNPRIHAWTLTTYDYVMAALADRRLSSHRPIPNLSHLTASAAELAESFYTTLSGWMVRCDPPEHTRLRCLVMQAFGRELVERTQSKVRQLANDLMDGLLPQRQIELISQFSAPLALGSIAQLIGIPSEELERLERSLDDIGLAAEGAPHPAKLECGYGSLIDLTDYIKELLERRRKRPEADLLSGLLSVDHSSHGLSEQEIISIIMLLLMAGRDTATHALANGVRSLLDNYEQLSALVADSSLAHNAVEELLRYDSPLQGLLRFATEDLNVGPKQITKGQTVLAWLGAANRDPGEFTQPDVLDIRRGASHHAGFGHGVHHCLGAWLARTILVIGLETLLDRAPRVRLATAVVEWQGNLLFRCQRALLVGV